ncbi:MAG: hypothetical protein WBZ15_08835 [Mycobacterium sp.]|uniref:hypothetical protein n=1 Tax=Mycobacterium sp. TaxID=1785 RepID=UPI003C625376
MLTRFALRQSCPSIAGHHQAHDFSQSFRVVYGPDRLRGIDDAEIAGGTPLGQIGATIGKSAYYLSERSVPFVTGQLALIHVLSNAFTPVDLAYMPSKPPGSHETWQNGTAARCGVPGWNALRDVPLE